MTMIARISAAESMPTPSGGPAEERDRPHPVGRARPRAAARTAPARRCPRGRRRSTGSPRAARSGTPAAAQPGGRELGDVDRDAERDRRGDEQGEDRRIERAPDERPRAELAGDRVPACRSARTASRTPGSPARDCRIQLDADAATRAMSRTREQARPGAEQRSRRDAAAESTGSAPSTAVLIFSSVFSSMSTTFFGQRRVAQLGGELLAVGERPLHEVDHRLRLRLVLRVLVEQQPGERRRSDRRRRRARW